MFTIIALSAAITVVGVARSIKLVATDGFGRVPTRKF